MSVNIGTIDKKLQAYQAEKNKLPALKEALTKIEELCRDAIRGQFHLARTTKHGFDLAAQVAEIMANIHTPDDMRAHLSSLAPALAKAQENFKSANRRRINLSRELTDVSESALSDVRTEICQLQKSIYEKIVRNLLPFTSEFSAKELARETDVYKALDHSQTNLGVIAAGDPETAISMLRSAVGSLEAFREMSK